MSKSIPAATYSHIGVCVADIERSKRFYTEVFGFQIGALYEMVNTINDLLGIPTNVLMTSQMMQLGNLVIELIHFRDPQPLSSGLRPMNQLGLTHLSFTVDDVDALAEHLEASGGKFLRETRTVIEMPDMTPAILLFCTDPDGTRIELYRPAGNLA